MRERERKTRVNHAIHLVGYIHRGQHWGLHCQRKKEREQFVHGQGWKVECIKVVWRTEERQRESEWEEEKKRGKGCLDSSCSFRVVKSVSWSVHSFKTWPWQRTLQREKERKKVIVLLLLDGLYIVLLEVKISSPSTPILPSPSESPAWRNVFVSASVRALALAEKFCRNSLERVIRDKWWAFFSF